MNDINNTTVWLKNSPMYQMSLGSRELFHSNFLAWLFESYPSSLEILGIDHTRVKQIEREKRNVDLVFFKESGEPLAILENKIKDIPRLAQLEKYSESFKNTENAILLTLVPASFDMSAPINGKKWCQLLYSNLVDHLRNWLENVEPKEKAKLKGRDQIFVNEYCDLVSNINKITKEYIDPDKIRDGYWFKGQNTDKLREIRFDDTVKKYQTQIFTQDIEKRLGEKFPGNSNTFFVNSSLNNKTPCVTVGIKKNNFDLMVQIQGNQYRRMIGSRSFNFKKDQDSKAASLLEIIKYSDGFEWLFASKISNKQFRVEHWDNKGPYETSMRKTLNSYAPSAIYQYLNISSRPQCAKELGYSHIMDNIVKDMEYAVSLLEDNSYVDRYKQETSSD